MISEKCEHCVYYFKMLEKIDPGIRVPIEGCVRDIEDSENCTEFTKKWHGQTIYTSKLDGGFHEESMTIDEYRDILKSKERQRLIVLRRMLREEREK